MSELGSTQATASHNPGLSASGNPRRSRGNPRAKEIKNAACRLMKCLGLVPTFRNLYIVQLAIETEMDISSTSIAAATDQIIAAAIAARQVGEHVDYFWFEDGCWRHPKRLSKAEARWRDNLRANQKAKEALRAITHSEAKCYSCADTREIWNQGPGRRRIPCPRCSGVTQ